MISILGDAYVIRTRDELDFMQARFETRSHHISFRATACSDVHVGLATNSDFVPTEMYEVVIGSSQNTRSQIRCESQKCQMVGVDTPAVLDCDRERSFWIQWENYEDQGSTVHS